MREKYFIAHSPEIKDGVPNFDSRKVPFIRITKDFYERYQIDVFNSGEFWYVPSEKQTVNELIQFIKERSASLIDQRRLNNKYMLNPFLEAETKILPILKKLKKETLVNIFYV